MARVTQSQYENSPADCTPRLKAVTGCMVAAVVAAVLAAAGIAPKLNPVGMACCVVLPIGPILKLGAPVWVAPPVEKLKPPVDPEWVVVVVVAAVVQPKTNPEGAAA